MGVNLKDSWILILLLVLGIIFLFPLISNMNAVGDEDWSQHLFYSEAPRQTILLYQQFPLWTPHQCGGNILFANPLNSFLSLDYLLIIFFGSIVGVKLEIILTFLFGLIGMYLLSRYYGLKTYFAALPPIIFMFSGPFIHYIGSGQLEMINMAFIPWVFYFYLKSLDKIKYSFLSSLLLALIWFNGGLYLFPFTILLLVFHFILYSIDKKKLDLKPLIIILLMAFFVSSIKILPSSEIFLENHRVITDIDSFGFDNFVRSLVSENFEPEKYGVHEYSSFVGILPAILFLFGLLFLWRTHWKLLLTSIFFLFLTLGSKAPINLLKIVHYIPVFSSMHVSARFRIIFLFCFAIISGLALQKIKDYKWKKFAIKKNKLELVVFLVFLVIIFNLIFVNMKVLQEVSFSRFNEMEKSELFIQTINENEDEKLNNEWNALLENKGSVKCYETSVIPTASKYGIWYYHTGSAIPLASEDYRGEVFLLNNGISNFEYWSPNKLVVIIKTTSDDILIVNQNYHKNWKVYDNQNKLKVQNYNGLIGISINKDVKSLTLYYLPKSFLIGSLVSFLSILIIIFYFKKNEL